MTTPRACPFCGDTLIKAALVDDRQTFEGIRYEHRLAPCPLSAKIWDLPDEDEHTKFLHIWNAPPVYASDAADIDSCILPENEVQSEWTPEQIQNEQTAAMRDGFTAAFVDGTNSNKTFVFSKGCLTPNEYTRWWRQGWVSGRDQWKKVLQERIDEMNVLPDGLQKECLERATYIMSMQFEGGLSTIQRQSMETLFKAADYMGNVFRTVTEIIENY